MGSEPDPREGRAPKGDNAGPPAVGGRGSKYQEKHKHIRGRGIISSLALGLIDGLVTNLSFLAGLSGAVSGMDFIRLAGLAAMAAGTVSMFFSGILEGRSESDLFEADSKREAFEIEHEREEELAELKGIYREKGLSEAEAEMVVRRISSDGNKFLEDVLTNELHIHRSNLQNPYKVGVVIGLSFLLGSFVPLVPYLLFSVRIYAAEASVVLALLFLFSAGVWRGRIVDRNQWVSGLETLLIGVAGTALLFAIGTIIGFV